MEPQTDLERAVRRSLTEAAAGVRPTGADLAGRAVGKGRRRRAVRGSSSAMAVVAVTMLASGVLLHSPEPTVAPYLGYGVVEPTPHSDTGGPEPSEPAAHPIPELEGRAGWIGADANARAGTGLVLASGDGTDVDLRHVRGVVSAYRIGDGWALVTGGDHPRLYWVSEQQRPTLVLAGLDALAVDNAQIAWRRGTALSAATMSSAGELEQRIDTRTADEAPDPVGFVGEAVLLGRAASPVDPEPGSWGVWRPAHDSDGPTVTAEVTEVFGGLPEGRTAVGLVPSAGQPCLALFDIEQALAVDQTVCPPLLPAAGHPATVSPDGRWLLGGADEPEGGGPAAGGSAGAAGEAAAAPAVTVLVDLRAAFAGAAEAVHEVEGVPGPAGRAVWPDSATVLYPVDGGVVHLRPELWVAGDADALEVLPSHGAPVVLVEVV